MLYVDIEDLRVNKVRAQLFKPSLKEGNKYDSSFKGISLDRGTINDGVKTC